MGDEPRVTPCNKKGYGGQASIIYWKYMGWERVVPVLGLWVGRLEFSLK